MSDLAKKIADNAIIGELVHTAFRKGCEFDNGVWEAIRTMEPDQWAAALATMRTWAVPEIAHHTDPLEERAEQGDLWKAALTECSTECLGLRDRLTKLEAAAREIIPDLNMEQPIGYYVVKMHYVDALRAVLSEVNDG